MISTMVFPKAELYCLLCGGKAGMFDAFTVGNTPELWARYEELRAEWDEHAAGKLLGRFWRRDCTRCENRNSRNEYHEDHATDEEREAHTAAVAWLEQRRGVAGLAS
jgi:hypothetical protein